MKKRYEVIKDATDVHSRNRLRRARKNEALPQLACKAGRVFNVVNFIGGPNRPSWVIGGVFDGIPWSTVPITLAEARKLDR